MKSIKTIRNQEHRICGVVEACCTAWESDLSGDYEDSHRRINRACVLSLAYFAGESGVRQAEVGLCLEHVWEQGLPHTGLSSSPNS